MTTTFNENDLLVAESTKYLGVHYHDHIYAHVLIGDHGPISIVSIFGDTDNVQALLSLSADSSNMDIQSILPLNDERLKEAIIIVNENYKKSNSTK